MSSTHVHSTAKKAPKQQRPIEREITIIEKSAEEIVAILAENPAVEKLKFELCFNEITSPVISAIFELKHLTSLDLSGNEIGPEGAGEIANHLVGSNVTRLNLEGNEISAETKEQVKKAWKDAGNDERKLLVWKMAYDVEDEDKDKD